MNIVFDIICLALLVIITLNGAKKGLASCLVSCVGAVAAVAIAVSLSAPVSELCYDVMFKNRIQAEVDRAVLGGAESPIDEGERTAEILADENGTVSRMLKTFGISTDEIARAVSAENIASVSENIVENIIKPPLLSLIKTVATIVLGTILLLIVSLLSKAAGKVFKITPLKGLDRGLGGLLGLLEGLIIVYLLVTVTKSLTVALPNGFLGLTAEQLGRSVSYKLMTGSFSGSAAQLFNRSIGRTYE